MGHGLLQLGHAVQAGADVRLPLSPSPRQPQTQGSLTQLSAEVLRYLYDTLTLIIGSTYQWQDRPLMMADSKASCFFSGVSSNTSEIRFSTVAQKKAASEKMYTCSGTCDRCTHHASTNHARCACD